jgi:hypothetical protein
MPSWLSPDGYPRRISQFRCYLRFAGQPTESIRLDDSTRFPGGPFHGLLVPIEELLGVLKAKRRFEYSVVLTVEYCRIEAAIFLLNLGSNVHQVNTGYASAGEIVIGGLGIDELRTQTQYQPANDPLGLSCIVAQKIVNRPLD